MHIHPGWSYWDTWCWDAPWHYQPRFEQGTVRTFELIPPPGYDQATATYFRRWPEETVRVELLDQDEHGVELTVLRDEHADGTLEDAIRVYGEDRDDAVRAYMRSDRRGEDRMPLADAQYVYEYLWKDLKSLR